VTTRAHLHTLNLSAAHCALFRALSFVNVLASFLAVLIHWFSATGHFGSVATTWHHFVHKQHAWVAVLLALAAAEVATGQQFLAVFTTSDFLWIFVTTHLERVSATTLLFNLQMMKNVYFN